MRKPSLLLRMPAGLTLAILQIASIRNVAAQATTPTEANRQTSVKVVRVGVSYGESGEAFVDVSTTNPAVYQILNLKTPPRLVVDIENARIENLKRIYSARSAVLKDARIGQFR